MIDNALVLVSCKFACTNILTMCMSFDELRSDNFY